jgi:hypothetical protein
MAVDLLEEETDPACPLQQLLLQHCKSDGDRGRRHDGAGYGPRVLCGYIDSQGGSFDVDEAQTSIDSLGRDFRMDEDIDAECVMVGADMALRLSEACA